MLTYNKVKIMYELIDMMLYIHRNRIPLRLFDNLSSLNSMSSPCHNSFSSVLKLSNDNWYIIAIHNHDEKYDHVNYNASIGHSEKKHKVSTFRSNSRELGLNIPIEDKIYDVLYNIDDIDSALFQLQTIYEDDITVTLLLEYYLRDKISSNFFLTTNLTHLLSLEEEELESILNFYTSHIENYNDNYA